MWKAPLSRWHCKNCVFVKTGRETLKLQQCFEWSVVLEKKYMLAIHWLKPFLCVKHPPWKSRVALIFSGSLTENPPLTIFKATEALKCTSLVFSILIWEMMTLCITEHFNPPPFWPMISLILSISHKSSVEDKHRAEKHFAGQEREQR